MLKKESTGLIVIDVQGKLARMVYDSEVLVANGGNVMVKYFWKVIKPHYTIFFFSELGQYNR
jgi:hypothetical protein